MKHYLAANGKPFVDKDAAEYKADAMSEQSGNAFTVIDVDGGFAVVADDKTKNVDEPKPAAAVSPNKPFVYTVRPAWRAQITAVFLLVIGLTLVFAPTWPIAIISVELVYSLNETFPQVWDYLFIVGVILCVSGVFLALVKRFWQKSVITNRGVTQSVGILLFNRISQIEMSNVHVVDAKRRNLVHMMLNLGTVELSTPGSGGADVAIVDVVAPNKLAEFIRHQVNASKGR